MLNQLNSMFLQTTLGEEAQNYRRRILRGLISMLLYLVPFVILIEWFQGKDSSLVFGFSVGLFGIGIVLHFLEKRGYIELACILWLVAVFVVVSVRVAGAGSARSPTAWLYLIVLMAGGLLYGKLGRWIAAFFCSGIMAGLMYVERLGWLPGLNTPPDVSEWVVYTVIFLAANILANLSIENIMNSLTQTRQELENRTRAEKELGENQKQLNNALMEQKELQSGLEYQADLLEKVSDAIISTDQNFHVVSWNRAAERIYGWSAEETVGKPLTNFFQENYPLEEQRQKRIEQLSSKGFWEGEVTHYHKNGSPIEIFSLVTLLKDDTGKITGAVGVNRDIRQRKQAEQALKDQEAILVGFYNSAPMIMGMFELLEDDIKIISCNQAAAQFFDTPLENLIDQNMSILGIPRGILDEWLISYRQAEQTHEPVRFEYEYEYGEENSKRWVAFTIQRVERHQTPARFACIGEDITARKGAELLRNNWVNELKRLVVERTEEISRINLNLVKELAERKRLQGEIERFFNLSVDLVCIAHTDGFFKRINPAFEDTLGFTEEEMLARPYMDFVHPEDIAATQAEIQNLSQGNSLLSFENRILCKDGQYKWLEWAAQATPDGFLYAIAHEITLKKQLFENLQNREEEFRILFDEAPVLYIKTQFVDSTPVIVAANKAFYTKLGYSRDEVIGKSLETFYSTNSKQTFLKQGGSNRGLTEQIISERELMTRSGEFIKCILNSVIERDFEGDIIGTRATFVDITERKKAEAALQLALKKTQALYQISQNMIVHKSLRSVLQTTAEIAVESLPANRISLVIVNFTYQIVEHFITSGTGVSEVMRVQYDELAEGLTGWVIRTGQVALSPKGTLDERESPAVRQRRVETNCGGILVVPLHHQDHILGTLTAINLPDERDFTQEDAILLQSIANQAASAVEYQRTVEQLKTRENQLSKAQALSKMGSWEWYTHTNKFLFSEELVRILGILEENTPFSYHDLVDRVHPADQYRLMRKITEFMRTKTTVSFDCRFLGENETIRVLHIKGEPVLDTDGTLLGAIGTGQNITERKIAENRLQETNENMSRLLDELGQRYEELSLLSQLGDALQQSLSPDEAYTQIEQWAPELFPQLAGGLYLLDKSTNTFVAEAVWGGELKNTCFRREDCLAIQKDQTQSFIETDSAIHCPHLNNANFKVAFCSVLHAHSDIIGVLHLRGIEPAYLSEVKKQLARTVADNIALCLANLYLQENLRQQSIRDDLTGLYNRRYLENILQKELSRVTRRLHPLSLIMLDIDHFKQYNDTYGHPGGDTLLRALGEFLQKNIRLEDIAFRYGGEEFTLVLPETSSQDAIDLAERIREKSKNLRVTHENIPLGTITISLGVAAFPEHGKTKEKILQAADSALFRSKTDGRDRVTVATPVF